MCLCELGEFCCCVLVEYGVGVVWFYYMFEYSYVYLMECEVMIEGLWVGMMWIEMKVL